MRTNTTAKLVMQYKTIEIGNVEAGDVIAKNGERITVNLVKNHEETGKPYFDTDLGYLIPFEETVDIENFECLVPADGTDLTTFFNDALAYIRHEDTTIAHTVHEPGHGTYEKLHTRMVSYQGCVFVIRATDTITEVWKRYVLVKEENGIRPLETSVAPVKPLWITGNSYRFADDLEDGSA